MRLPTYFISHGGGPWPYIPEMRANMRQLESSLRAITEALSAPPKAVLMISGHWEAQQFTIMSSEQPSMLYDYGGFPAYTYQISYPAVGAPWLVARLKNLIAAADLPLATDNQRGLDHGAFSPLAVMYPDANIPVVQLSLQCDFDPAQHIALGRAIAPLRDEHILIIGSGFSYHNLSRMGAAAQLPSAQFDAWLQRRVVGSRPDQRVKHLIDWQHAPAARIAHPREDHLMPLMVALGAAEHDNAVCCYHETNIFGGVVASSFKFG